MRLYEAVLAAEDLLARVAFADDSVLAPLAHGLVGVRRVLGEPALHPDWYPHIGGCDVMMRLLVGWDTVAGDWQRRSVVEVSRGESKVERRKGW